MPEVEPLVHKASQTQFVEQEIQYRKNNELVVLSVKIENIKSSDSYGTMFVLTFDDLTNMIIAQRKAAWADVARRVAHEIKNPLTPIQLSAERIRRKYISQISTDKETFSELVNVIVRQVGDIKRLIDDFTSLARLPEPVMRLCTVYEICKQAVFFMQNVSSNIDIAFVDNNGGSNIINAKADERLLHQSIVNLLQNAINILNTLEKNDKKIKIGIEIIEKMIYVSIEDNGPGLPKEKIESLATPYFTMMPKGTGLGLAIVKKIIQDHGGDLLFGDSSLGGAKVTISIPAVAIQN
jgi:two-component system nitrogen regulation sensor histidine kinase NtrY